MSDAAPVDADQTHPLMLLAELVLALGDTNIKSRPGLYYQRIDDRWEFWLNPHREPLDTDEGTTVPPFAAYLQWNGWPVSFVNAHRDVVFAVAPYEDFRAAVEARIAQVRACR